MDPVVLARYAARNRILRRLDRASTEGLKKFAEVLEALSDPDLDRMARYAEALAEWPDPDVSSR
jgi:hypothetical protein